MNRLRNGLLSLAAVALMAGGCAHGSNAVRGGDADSADETFVKVTSFNWSDINVYVVRGNWRQRLGTVNSFSTQTFRLPSHLLTTASNVYLLADPIGARTTYRSPPLLLTPGQVVEWRLENNLNLSSAFVH